MFFFYCQVGDGGFTSKESPPSESSDSSVELSVSASGFRGMGGGKAKGQGHGRWGLGLFTCRRAGALGFTWPNRPYIATGNWGWKV